MPQMEQTEPLRQEAIHLIKTLSIYHTKTQSGTLNIAWVTLTSLSNNRIISSSKLKEECSIRCQDRIKMVTISSPSKLVLEPRITWRIHWWWTKWWHPLTIKLRLTQPLTMMQVLKAQGDNLLLITRLEECLAFYNHPRPRFKLNNNTTNSSSNRCMLISRWMIQTT